MHNTVVYKKLLYLERSFLSTIFSSYQNSNNTFSSCVGHSENVERIGCLTRRNFTRRCKSSVLQHFLNKIIQKFNLYNRKTTSSRGSYGLLQLQRKRYVHQNRLNPHYKIRQSFIWKQNASLNTNCLSVLPETVGFPIFLVLNPACSFFLMYKYSMGLKMFLFPSFSHQPQICWRGDWLSRLLSSACVLSGVSPFLPPLFQNRLFV